MKKFLYFFVALVVFFCVTVVPLNVAAQGKIITPIELTEQDYAAYIQRKLDEPVVYAAIPTPYSVNLDKNITSENYESTNAPKPDGVGSIGSSITSGIRDFGIEIIKDIINDSAIENNSNGLQVPDFRQQIGKCRIVYSSGLVEILTCSLTTYSTQIIGVLGQPTGEYKPHAILTFVRESSNRYTVSTICDNDATKYCDSYATTGTFTFGTYMPYFNSAYVDRFFDYELQDVISSPRVQLLGQRYTTLTFADIATTAELGNTTFAISNLVFGTATRQGLPEINSGYQYKTIQSLVGGGYAHSGATGGTSIQGLCLATSNTITNNYQDFIQYQENEGVQNPPESSGFTYLQDVNSTNIYNENTVNNYSFLTYEGGRITTNASYDSWWQSNVTNTVNNNVYNTYNNYYYEQQPTESPTEPPTDPPEPTETYPVVTLPTETYYIVDFETLETVSLEVGTLPGMYEFPEVAEVGGLVLQQSTSFLDNIGLLPVYITLGILSIAVFVMRGQR